ncbi:TIGR03084 family metal-binding protein [Actinomadura parmotrematis]|uniref:TIGR03084 family protein n=1 Tax=Actinomadura parmotrematis TaxID=2864039 RepID=A0ABS7G154_9ACTN|nr:TIGR03084 family metal-binding protein [Actinomadura parmotrematis]MBW8485378.1 TIGR03084 family protein [Actinomadura parmotrematis]
MPDITSLLADLAAEGDALDALVAPLDAAGWATPTPAPGWTVTHQVSHLEWTDRQSLASIEGRFDDVLIEAAADPGGLVEAGAAAGTALPHGELLARWRAGRAALVTALAGVPDGTKLPWFGPPMGAASMATARIMETFAHGQDVADALGAARPATARLRHVAHIGVRTRDFAHANRGLAPPAEPFRVELAAPDGSRWAWGPEDAAQRVAGPALDFCLLVTQRRHRADLALTADGADADRWLDIAQAFAGPPGAGRPAAEADA